VGVVWENRDLFFDGLRLTVALTLVSFAVAFVIGLLLASFRVSPVAPLRWFATAYVELVRNTPLTALFVLFYFGFPKIGIQYGEFRTAVVVLALYTGAFLGEIIRSGINTVAAGQAEAARALGLSFPQVLRHVVLPQALRTVVGPIGSIFSALIRNSSIALAIAVHELMFVSNKLANDLAQPSIYFGAAVAYLVLTIPSGFFFEALERKVAVRR
jgi:His/Glu/Gln/Arg/opine family amino acid ABC transporter permease subunit